MADEFLPTGLVHAHAVLEKWERLSDVSVALVQNYLGGIEDKGVLDEYISRILDIWKQLYPKVKDREDYGLDIKESFEKFKKFRDNPGSIVLSETSLKEFLQMEETISVVLEKMHITDFEVGKK